MTSQIIKYAINNKKLFDLLDKICNKYNNKYYILNKVSFKQAVYYNYLDDFRNKLIDHYYLSKQYYIVRKLDFLE